MNELFKTHFSVIGFEKPKEYATLDKSFESEKEARTFVDKIKNNYFSVVLRQEDEYIGNNEKLLISTSSVVAIWEWGEIKNGIHNN